MIASLRCFIAHVDSQHTVTLTETDEDLWRMHISGPQPVYSLNVFRSAEQAREEAEILVRHHLKRSNTSWQGLEWREQTDVCVEPRPIRPLRASTSGRD